MLPGVPVAGALGDQQAALVGQACFAPGEVKCTYGTGAFLLMNTGARPATSTHGLIPTVGYRFGADPVYALEGAIAMTGSLVQWFRDSLRMIGTAAQIETLARTVPDNGGCYIVPAFSGLYSPRWHPDARGVMVGLTSFIDRGHLARAVLEATGWQTREVVDAMNADSGVPVTRLKVDGGMTANHLLMQFVADVLDVPVERPLGSEAVSLGAAYAAGLAVGYWSDLEVMRANWHRAAAWEPAMDPARRRAEHANWLRAVDRSYGWVQTRRRGLTAESSGALRRRRRGRPDRVAGEHRGQLGQVGHHQPGPVQLAGLGVTPGHPDRRDPVLGRAVHVVVPVADHHHRFPARVQPQPLQHRADHGRLADPARDVVRPADQREVPAEPTPATIRRARCSGFEVATASRSPAARSSPSSAGMPG